MATAPSAERRPAGPRCAVRAGEGVAVHGAAARVGGLAGACGGIRGIGGDRGAVEATGGEVARARDAADDVRERRDGRRARCAARRRHVGTGGGKADRRRRRVVAAAGARHAADGGVAAAIGAAAGSADRADELRLGALDDRVRGRGRAGARLDAGDGAIPAPLQLLRARLEQLRRRLADDPLARLEGRPGRAGEIERAEEERALGGARLAREAREAVRDVAAVRDRVRAAAVPEIGAGAAAPGSAPAGAASATATRTRATWVRMPPEWRVPGASVHRRNLRAGDGGPAMRAPVQAAGAVAPAAGRYFAASVVKRAWP